MGKLQGSSCLPRNQTQVLMLAQEAFYSLSISPTPSARTPKVTGVSLKAELTHTAEKSRGREIGHGWIQNPQ